MEREVVLELPRVGCRPYDCRIVRSYLEERGIRGAVLEQEYVYPFDIQALVRVVGDIEAAGESGKGNKKYRSAYEAETLRHARGTLPQVVSLFFLHWG